MKSKAAPIVLCGLLFLCLFQLSVDFNSYYKGDFALETFSSTISDLATMLFVSAILLVASIAIFCKTNNRFALYIFAIFTFICYWVFWRNYCEYSYNYEFKFWDLFFANFLHNLFSPTIIIFVLFIISTTSWKKKIEYSSLTSKQINAMLCFFFFALTLIFVNREFAATGSEGTMTAPYDSDFMFKQSSSYSAIRLLLIIFAYLFIAKKQLNIFTPIVIISSFICLNLMNRDISFAYEIDRGLFSHISLVDIDKAKICYLLTFLLLSLSSLSYYGLQIYKIYKTVAESKTKSKAPAESQLIPGYELLSDDDKIKAQDYIRQILEQKNENPTSESANHGKN